MAAKVIKELCDVLSSIPIYQDKYISMIDILLSEYHETCFSKFNGLFFHPTSTSRIAKSHNFRSLNAKKSSRALWEMMLQ